jgi:4-diphosphocytidyl-2-C-methyl-D-erythritol kinase
MVNFPPCKINLGLNVIEKRSDGFHNLETCFYPIPFTDVLEIIKSKSLSFAASGNAIPGNSADNLCLRAYELLRKDFALAPVAIHLHKVIPTGAGLGGGSADAAYTLRLLNTLFDLNLSEEVLKNYAQQLGSDCAFFIQDEPQLGTSRGEVLEPISLSLQGKFFVLLKPNIHVATAEAYKGVVPKKQIPSVKSIIEQHPIAEWKELLKNDFEESILKSYPLIKKYKQELYEAGAIYAAMSGSGSSVFGIFSEPVDVLKYFTNDVIWSGQLSR